MKALIYTRVSSKDQVEGTSLTEQKRWALKQAKSRKIPKSQIELYEEPGVSAESIFARPQMQALLARIESGEVDGAHLFSWRQDRLTRSARDWHAIIEPELIQHQIQLITENGRIKLDNIDGKFMADLDTLLSQKERETIVYRCKKGIQATTDQGFISGPLAKGYEWDRTKTIQTTSGRKRLTIKQGKQAEFIKQVFNLALHHSPIEVAEILAQKGNNLVAWDITKILRKPIYAGMIYNSKHELIDCPQVHKPIVSKSQWHEINNRLRREKQTRGPRNKYVLSPYLYCGYCGYKMRYKKNFSKKGVPRGLWEGYTCGSKAISKSICRKSKAQQRKVLELEVLFAIKQKLLENKAALRAELENSIIKDKRKDPDQIKKQIKSLQKRKENLIDAIELGTIDRQTVKNRMADINSKLKSMQSQVEDRQINESEIDDMLEMIENLHDMTDNEIAQYYSQLIKKIVVFRDYIEIYFTCLNPVKRPLPEPRRGRPKRR